ncbi:hypothetical protein HAX54_013913, partial [Datura stramonium]|nr:hypothetical protein [Datura stramonium]
RTVAVRGDERELLERRGVSARVWLEEDAACLVGFAGLAVFRWFPVERRRGRNKMKGRGREVT